MEFDLKDIIQFTPEELVEQQNNNDTNDTDPNEDQKPNSDSSDSEGDVSNDKISSEEKDEEIEDEESEEDDEDAPVVDLNKFFTTLKDSNYLTVPEDFKFDGTTESLAEAIDLTYEKFKDSAKESLLNALDDESKLALRYALANGKPLYSFYEENDTADYSNVDLDDEDTQKSIVRDYLRKTTSFNDTKIENQIKILSKTGEIVTEAKDSLTELIALQQQERQELEEKIEQQNQKRKEDLAKWKQDRVDVIKSFKEIDDTRKNKLKAFVVNEIYTDRSKEPTTELVHVLRKINSNPEHYVQLADMLMDYDETKGFDLERLTTKLNTKLTSSLKDKLDSTSALPKGKQIRKKIEEEFNWDEWAKHL